MKVHAAFYRRATSQPRKVTTFCTYFSVGHLAINGSPWTDTSFFASVSRKRIMWWVQPWKGAKIPSLCHYHQHSPLLLPVPALIFPWTAMRSRHFLLNQVLPDTTNMILKIKAMGRLSGWFTCTLKHGFPICSLSFETNFQKDNKLAFGTLKKNTLISAQAFVN